MIDINKNCIKSLHFKDFNMNVDTDVDTCIGDGTLNNEMYMKFGQEQGIPLFIDGTHMMMYWRMQGSRMSIW